jgi:hypothetical protein
MEEGAQAQAGGGDEPMIDTEKRLCLECGATIQGEYPVCDDCEYLCHFPDRVDCRCDVCRAEPGRAPDLKLVTIDATRLSDDDLELLIKRLTMVRDERKAKSK